PLVRREDVALQRDLRLRGDRQARALAAHDRVGAAVHVARDVEFGQAGRRGVDARPGGRGGPGLLPGGDHDGALVAARPVLLGDAVAVLPVLDEYRAGALVHDRDAVGADVHEAAAGVAVDDTHARADVAAAVGLVPLRRRKPVEIDVRAR